MANEPTPEVFRGHLEECLKHFIAAFLAASPKGTRRASKAKMPIAAFCGVDGQTVAAWLYRGHSPVGEVLIKLMYYLDLIGYRVIELERMSKSLRNFAELIGFGLITANQATKLLNYTDTATLYRALRGTTGIGKDRERIMWDAWKERREALELKKEEFRSNRKFGTTRAVPKRTPELEPPPPEVTPPPHTANNRIKAILCFMEGLALLLQEESKTDKTLEIPPQDLENFTRLAQDLSARFNALVPSQASPKPEKEQNGG